MKIDKSSPSHWLLLGLQGLYCLIAIALRPFTRKPDIPLVILYGHQFSGNLKALYDQWLATHRNRMSLQVLSLDPEHARSLEQDGIQVLRCNRLTDMLYLARCSAMITDHGLHLMTPLLRFTDIRFIDVWHGIPFKGFVPEDFALQHRYGEVWVSSERLAQLYREQFGFQDSQLKCLGYARTDRLFRAAAGPQSCEADIALPLGKYALYAPTWQQDEKGRELFPFGESGESFISAIADTCAAHGATLLVRSHLNSEISQFSHPNVTFCSQRDYPDTEAILLQADILICDWSSIAFDYLALRRPTLFLDVPPPFKNGFSLDGSYRAGAVITGMECLRDSLGTFLNDPAEFGRLYARLQDQTLAEIYQNQTQGAAARLQLDHLARQLQRSNP